MTPPSIPHSALFIYSESFAQSEDGRRFHVFARLEDSHHWIFFYTRDKPEQPITIWYEHDLAAALATQIEDTFGALKIPLNAGVRTCNDQQHYRGLESQVQGASFYLGWDTADSELADALEPLINLLRPLVDEMKAVLDANDPQLSSNKE
ncbi:MAG: hypothetical protein K9N47_23530 [Prosthecobacter sp.]|uniref:hypothetical protein n=1 Tax=Prosthecobacter sp. TaxID=1965333 RepID=UPI002607693C|nr:hypothetical protein [Prosthecobacter sp.]MCF7789116.1 hypothetical protein [Prosthecobacter sp.]